ncbi:MAG TPA: pyruvate kinase [Burkholderiaceae bacterium]|nr:pyruvate kinase [Burkholderiaceae bacterium]
MPPLPSREILCTVGPASLNERVLVRLEDLGVTLFRINLSHTRLDDLPRVVDFIRAHSKVPVCLDTEGAQMRTGNLAVAEVTVQEHALIHVHRDPVPGDAANLNFYPEEAFDLLREGDLVSIDFNAVLVQVVGKDERKVTLRVLHEGTIGRNKAVTVERDVVLPAITAKDRAALAWGRHAGIRHVALSFAHRGEDVDAARALIGAQTFLISKIECRPALRHLNDIARRSDALLIDRGDLSRQEPIERIPALQKAIVRRGKALSRKVYVATNLLESMITLPRPTRAEVNDVVNTLIDGADGLVLAAETAIGRHPVDCVGMVVKLIHEFDRYRLGEVGLGSDYRETEGTSFLPAPHGGPLAEQWADAAAAAEAERLPRWLGDAQALADAEALALGVYTPLRGFMTEDEVRRVVHEGRLADGTPWPRPVVLAVTTSDTPVLSPGRRIALADVAGVVRAIVDVDAVFEVAPAPQGHGWLTRTPGAAKGGKARFVAGKVQLVRRTLKLSPRESRFVFHHKGWQRIVGTQSAGGDGQEPRHAERAALEAIRGDGIFVPSTACAQADAPAALLAALAAKNHGCSHFLVDPALGRGEVEGEIERLGGDIGIVPLYADSPAASPQDRA